MHPSVALACPHPVGAQCSFVSPTGGPAFLDGGLSSAEPRAGPISSVGPRTVKRFIIAFLWALWPQGRTRAAPPVHIVIPEDKFGEASGPRWRRGGRYAAGTLVRISFDY